MTDIAPPPRKRDRPLSPHLQVYKPQLTSVLSICHRATGIFLTLGLGLFSWWIIALADGPEAFDRVRGFSASALGVLLQLGWIWTLFFHLGTGIRHLFWDAGYGYSIPATYRSGWAVVVLSAILAIVTAIACVYVGLVRNDECYNGGC